MSFADAMGIGTCERAAEWFLVFFLPGVLAGF